MATRKECAPGRASAIRGVIAKAAAGLLLVVGASASLTKTTARSPDPSNVAESAPGPSGDEKARLNRRPPNIVVILADDLDETLGSSRSPSLAKARRRILGGGGSGGRGGLSLRNWFAHTPVCCPSRAELLTGRMFHNLRRPEFDPPLTNHCMHVDVSSDVSHPFYSDYYFARYFASVGYGVGVFGKHLNRMNPAVGGRAPPGVDRWLANGGGSYLNPAFDWAARWGDRLRAVRFDNCTDARTGERVECYSTSVIGNASVAWIREVLTASNGTNEEARAGGGGGGGGSDGRRRRPFFALISTKAPHTGDQPGPYPVAVPAPWYDDAAVAARAPRTPNYNASCPDHHWLVRSQPPVTPEQERKSDELHVSRLRSLLSVDDLVEDLFVTLEEFDAVGDTYVVFTSDHGYRLGQFRMPSGKWNAYENDLRVPFWITGPGIARRRRGRGSEAAADDADARGDNVLGTHVDLMPTLLGLVRARTAGRGGNEGDDGVDDAIPDTMDGADLAPDLLGRWRRRLGRRPPSPSSRRDGGGRRTSILIEHTGGEVVSYGHREDAFNNTFRALRVLVPDDAASRRQRRRNLKYVEYYDCLEDWNYTAEEPREAELFDLDEGPFEVRNLLAAKGSMVPEGLVRELKREMRRLYSCSGRSCREWPGWRFDSAMAVAAT